MATVVTAGKVSSSGLIHLDCRESFYVEDVDEDGAIFGKVVIAPEEGQQRWLLASGGLHLSSDVPLSDRRIATYLWSSGEVAVAVGHVDIYQLPSFPGGKDAGGTIALSMQMGAEPVTIGVAVAAIPLHAGEVVPRSTGLLGKCELLADIIVRVSALSGAFQGVSTADVDALPGPTETVSIPSPFRRPVLHPSPVDVDLYASLARPRHETGS
ncbi:MAG: hypothetical protein ABI948_09275 [Thermoleophilia bacterium]